MSKNGYVCVFVWSLLHGNAVVIKTTCLNGREMPKSVLSHFIMSVLKKKREVGSEERLQMNNYLHFVEQVKHLFGS